MKAEFFDMPEKRLSRSVLELKHCITLKKMNSAKNAPSRTRSFCDSLKCEVKKECFKNSIESRTVNEPEKNI